MILRKNPLMVMLAMAVATIFAFTSCKAKKADEPMSVRMVQSEIARMPQSWMLDFSKALKWNYCHGLELQAFLDVADMYPEHQEFVDYAVSYADTIINEEGNILTYKQERFNLDHINSGKILFRIYDKTKNEKYRKALMLLRDQLSKQPRTSEGGFWHKQVYPNQMWLDGLYMEAPFYAEYASRFNEPDAWDDITNQFVTVARHTYDPATGLYRHAWDESREMGWADSLTGQAPHVWGRAVGWYMMAMVDVLDFMPQSHPGRDSLLNIFQPLSERLLAYQDSTTGAWSQVLDMPDREGNYLETSCTSMFAYAFMKGARKGYLAEKFRDAGLKAYNGLVENFVTTDEEGNVSLTRVCGVAGLGGTPYRDGSFDYYVNEVIRDNDPKGVAPFIMAALEAERLQKK
jgi:unsaturated rhamnogalacturonyl hydrolase